ncbi:MAG: Slp family lipoprotein, partial [Sulfurifustaceae bacterium]
PGDLSIAQAREDIAVHVGQRVRWGGRITGVENHANETWLDIVGRPLDSNGRPRSGDESLGRFIARVNGFLDPAIYAKGREVTVAGTVERTITRSIGDYPYPYVVVNADMTELWELRVERPVYYDPFYDPFWPTRMYPWYAPYPFYPYPYWPYW